VREGQAATRADSRRSSALGPTCFIRRGIALRQNVGIPERQGDFEGDGVVDAMPRGRENRLL